jgi:hypothetical protein
MDIVTDEEGMGATTWLGRYFWYNREVKRQMGSNLGLFCIGKDR